ncbi:IS110 family transposase, partial [Hafnia paralvei]
KDIRKVKNDKKDALSIAKIGKFEDIKAYSFLDINIFTIKSLCRDYYKLIDIRSAFKKKLSADLRVIFPGYSSVFSDVTGLSSTTILKNFQNPEAIIDAPKEVILQLLRKSSRKNMAWCNKTYNKLLKVAYSAKIIAISSPRFSVKIISCIETIEGINKQASALMSEIKTAVYSDDTTEQFKYNVDLLMTIPGLGFLTAVTILTETGDFSSFSKPKQLVAYFGIDPSVNESGKFKSDKDKMSKRGTRFGRRSLYAVALASIRSKRNGQATNKILLDYYKTNLVGKKKKVALVAIMHKLINYIFAILRD